MNFRTDLALERCEILNKNSIDGIKTETLSYEKAKVTRIDVTNKKGIYRHSYTAEHYIFSRRNNKAEPLSENGAQQVPKFSPDGNLIAFVRDNNIFLVKLMFNNSESQITTDGEFRKIINGIPDWVNEEEFTSNCSFDFSADSKCIAYIKYDESEVMMYDMPMYSGGQSKEYFDFSKPYSFKYPVAGADNAKVSVHSFDIKSRVTRQLDVNIPEEGYIPRIKFTKDPNTLAVLTLNRHQSVLEVQAVNPLSGVSKTILREESDTYLNEQTYSGIEFLDKYFVFQSERSGYNHLYLYNLAGELVRPITSGNYEVKKFYGWDSKKNEFYYSSNEGSPLRESIYKVNAKGKKTKLTKEEGTNSAVFSSGMKYFINTYSSIDTPHTVTTNDNNGKQLKTLIEQMRSEGKTLLVSTHIIDSVDMLWDRTIIMQDGQIRANLTREELERDGRTLEQLFFDVTEGIGRDAMSHTEDSESQGG